jgi:hypothetical protein
MRDRSRRLWPVVALLSVCLIGAADVAASQSLAETARREEARRKAVKKPAKVYTNASLRSVPGEVIPTPPRPVSEEEPPSAGGAASGQQSVEAQAAATADPTRTQEYWKKRMADAVQERDNNALMLEALESRVNGLWAEFTARDNPLERATIASNRQKALDELERRKARQVALVKAISDLEDEARRAGIPPGWLR